MASSDGETCYDDDYSSLDDDSSLGGWLVQDDFVEYIDENDAYLDDEEEEPVSCTTLTRKKRRLLRAEPETDDEQDIRPTKRKWLVLDEDDEPLAQAVA